LRRANNQLCSREHLTETEVGMLIQAAKKNRCGHRDATMILVAYRHGLRASEICDLRWEQFDFTSATLHVRRVKNGKPSTHPLRGDELRALRKLERDAETLPFAFVSERGAPFTTDSFNWMVKRAGRKAGLRSKSMRICFDMLADTSSQAMDKTQDQSRTISATETFNIPFVTRSFRPNGSKAFFVTEIAH
jgi:integrase